MTEPWFDENMFGTMVGGVGGSVFGTLGGLWGALVGMLAPQGKGRTWLIAIGWLFVGVGVAFLAVGIYALAAGQPYGIWFGPCLIGFIMVCVVGGLMPIVYKRYAEADARRLQAEEFRSQ